MGCYCTAEVTGPDVIMTTIPESMGHRAAKVTVVEAIVTMIPKLMGRSACGMFRFCAVVPLSR
jgi:hypothetical protein